MEIKALSYENWMKSVSSIYSIKPKNNDKFHYNIMHTDAFKTIDEKIKKIEELSKLPNKDKNQMNKLFKEIEDQYVNLYYYEETYVYAHYVFNNIRKNIIESFKQLGGGHITLEEFKQKIRDKIKDI
jgi:hypothetical protein